MSDALEKATMLACSKLTWPQLAFVADLIEALLKAGAAPGKVTREMVLRLAEARGVKVPATGLAHFPAEDRAE